MVVKNSMKVTMKRKTDSVNIEMIKAISVGDTLEEWEIQKGMAWASG